MITARRVKLILLGIFVSVIGLAVLYTWASLNWAYSEGERAGFLQKLSKRGYICKTWEGELLMSATPGALPEKFQFTVRDEAMARELEKVLNKSVVLGYEQRKGVPTSCFGDTPYFIEKFRLSNR
jgi:hypothetical protein